MVRTLNLQKGFYQEKWEEEYGRTVAPAIYVRVRTTYFTDHFVKLQAISTYRECFRYRDKRDTYNLIK